MPTRRSLTAAALLLTLALLGGWGRRGHSVIAEIAYRDLTPAARARVDAIMQGETIQETASWADGVRGQNDEFPWTAPLHYASIPADLTVYTHAEQRPEQGNVVDGVVDFAYRVIDPALTDLERKQALMFLVHFVGDLHQPLHAGNAEDRGGNAIRIAWLTGDQRNLHSIWDSGIADVTDAAEWPATADRLYGEIDPADRLAWTASDPLAPADLSRESLTAAVGRWLIESRRYASRYAYRAEGFNEGQPFTTGVELGEAYAKHCAPIVELREQQAGVRLASLLNALLSEPAPAP